MPGDIAPPDKAEMTDYCLYIHPEDGGICVVRIDTPPKMKRFENIEQALAFLEVQTRTRSSIGWVSSDYGHNWTGYTGSSLDAEELVKGFE